ncbi:MAG: HD domain-containing protein [Clostridiales bacterium]|nr:HD domain-containing protein [Clostridiales bacterium]
MIYTELTIKAMKTAYSAHAGQVDQCNVPYIFHPYHLAEQMDDEISCCAALLHDVVEDTDITLAMLEQEFPKAVTEAVRLLTHDDDTDYADYLRKIKEDPVAKKVKLADIRHNSDQTRCVGAGLPEEQLQQWAQKYAYALRILLS